MSDAQSFSSPQQAWQRGFVLFFRPAVLRMLFLGFSSGLPYAMLFSVVFIRLKEAGIEQATITFFSWAALAYSFKFLWAPLVDQLSLPLLTKRLGQRRSWMLAAQIGAIGGMLWSSCFDPASTLWAIAVGSAVIGLSAATQDVAIDAYRIESGSSDLQTMMAAVHMAGYRLGMAATGSGGLWLAGRLEPAGTYSHGAWAMVYQLLAALLLIGIATVLLSPEPKTRERPFSMHAPTGDHLRLLFTVVCAVGAFILTFALLFPFAASQTGLEAALPVFLAKMLQFLLSAAASLVVGWCLTTVRLARAEHLRISYLAPCTDFLERTGPVALWILALIGIYRIADIVMGSVAHLFYIDLAFTKTDIAQASFWGIWATLAGGFIGGIVAFRIGIVRSLVCGALAAGATNLLFSALALGLFPSTLPFLVMVVALDNIAGGFASAAFIAYLSSLTNVAFTATQYALFSSFMTLFPKILAGYSGLMSEKMGYASFFAMTAALTLPVLALIWMIDRRSQTQGKSRTS